MAIDLGKISTVLQWPIPCSVKEVRGFLGLTRYYRRFVKDYGKVARPLIDLLKKEGFYWGAETQLAFDQLKIIMTSTPVLAMSDFQKELTVECDGSRRGIGVD